MTSTLSEAPVKTAQNWYPAVQADLASVEGKMQAATVMGFGKLDSAVKALILAGGKRVRPALTILVGRALGADAEKILSVAASIELLHTATLIHDDLIDESDARRGAPTLHSRLPLGVTVLTGDFVFAQAASLAADADNVAVMRLFADTLVRICKGEILQAQTRYSLPSLAVYEERIYGKTAALFEAATQSAAILGQAKPAEISALAEFGRKLGLAFQIVDDALDYLSTTETLGKPAGHDLSQGVFNLPVMYYVEAGYITEAELLAEVESGESLAAIVTAITDSGMVEKSMRLARQYLQEAAQILSKLPPGADTDTLRHITDYVLSRTY